MDTDPAERTAGRTSPAALVVRINPAVGGLVLIGRLDGRTSHQLYDGITDLLRSPQPTWILDVAGVTVADHAGLRAIAGAYRRALRHQRRITVQGASPGLQYALTRMRLGRHVLPAEGPVVPAAPESR